MALSLFGIILAVLLIPLTMHSSIGEYQKDAHRPSLIRRSQFWAFLFMKIAVLLATAYFASLDLGCSLAQPLFRNLQAAFILSFSALTWAFRDQQRRCPVCLRRLSHPVEVGQLSRTFLAWSGTELRSANADTSCYTFRGTPPVGLTCSGGCALTDHGSSSSPGSAVLGAIDLPVTTPRLKATNSIIIVCGSDVRAFTSIWASIQDLPLRSRVFEVCRMSAARLALLTLLATPLLQSQNDSPDGLRLLQQISQHYASATTWYIEAAEERTIEDESCSLSTNTSLLIGAQSGNEYQLQKAARRRALRCTSPMVRRPGTFTRAATSTESRPPPTAATLPTKVLTRPK